MAPPRRCKLFCPYLHEHGEFPPVPSEPNGRYAGPGDDPARHMLFGFGRKGTEGVLWRARLRAPGDGPPTCVLKVFHPKPGQEETEPPLPADEHRRTGSTVPRWRTGSSTSGTWPSRSGPCTW
ncbi:MAG TPA: hypothetical protein VN408_36155 [Actinoplanes sp.]|nr:hypothetical protein [Actinoplanes sp.]